MEIFMGKSSINGSFSMAMLNNHRVIAKKKNTEKWIFTLLIWHNKHVQLRSELKVATVSSVSTGISLRYIDSTNHTSFGVENNCFETSRHSKHIDMGAARHLQKLYVLHTQLLYLNISNHAPSCQLPTHVVNIMNYHKSSYVTNHHKSW